MPIRNIDSSSSIERVPDVEREAYSAEHEKKSEQIKRAARQQQQKEKSDTWCGSENEPHDPQEDDFEEEPAFEAEDEKPKSKLDYKA